MSICTPCTKAKTIYKCSDSLIVGELDAITDYDVWIEDITTTATTVYSVTSTLDGTIEIDPSGLPTKHTLRATVKEGFAYVNFGLWDGTDYSTMVECVDFIVENATDAPTSQILTIV